MPRRDEYLHYVLDLLAPLRGCTAKAMFGGYGLFFEGTMFGLIADNRLYFKVDEALKRTYLEHGQAAFTFYRGNKPIEMKYYSVPEDALEDGENLCRWASLSIALDQ